MKSPSDPADEFKFVPQPKQAPAPAPEVWTPTETPGIERNQQGQVRTNIPSNEMANLPWYYGLLPLGVLDA